MLKKSCFFSLSAFYCFFFLRSFMFQSAHAARPVICDLQIKCNIRSDSSHGSFRLCVAWFLNSSLLLLYWPRGDRKKQASNNAKAGLPRKKLASHGGQRVSQPTVAEQINEHTRSNISLQKGTLRNRNTATTKTHSYLILIFRCYTTRCSHKPTGLKALYS